MTVRDRDRLSYAARVSRAETIDTTVLLDTGVIVTFSPSLPAAIRPSPTLAEINREWANLSPPAARAHNREG